MYGPVGTFTGNASNAGSPASDIDPLRVGGPQLVTVSRGRVRWNTDLARSTGVIWPTVVAVSAGRSV